IPRKPRFIKAAVIMSSPPAVELFKGTGWEECDTFIRSIRSRALWEGKARDGAWMADFASPLFSRQAMVWYTRLPQDVREDWFKLQTDLLERWPPPEEAEGTRVKPTPAAAGPSQLLGTTSKPLEGVIKIVGASSAPALYLENATRRGICSVTRQIANALRVRCCHLSDTILLECTNDPDCSWLAVHWTKPVPKIGNGSTDTAFITLVDPKTLKSNWDVDSPYRPVMGSVSTDSELLLTWKLSNGSTIPLHVFTLIGLTINLVSDPLAFRAKVHDEETVRLFIEPAVDRGTAVNKAALAVDTPLNMINESNRAVPVHTEPMEVESTAPSAAVSRDLQMILVQVLHPQSPPSQSALKDLSTYVHEADGRILAKSPELIAALLDFAALPPFQHVLRVGIKVEPVFPVAGRLEEQIGRW
ncbi:hypothetical protein FRB90_012130, partial [Tulasnella sp. 427]